MHIIPIKGHASELHQNVLLELLAHAAFMESRIADNMGAPEVDNSPDINKTHEKLLLAYQFMNHTIEADGNLIDDEVIAYTMSRVGWFMHQTHRADEDLKLSPYSMIVKAHQLSPSNATYIFQLAMISEDKDKIGYLEKAVQMEPDFPEAIIELMRTKIRLGLIESSSDEANRYRDSFLQNLENYRPALSFFDCGYPLKNTRIIVYANQGIVPRQIYHSFPSRFEFIIPVHE